MKKIDDEYLKKIAVTKKYSELFDFSTLEVRMAFIFTFLIIILESVMIWSGGKNMFVSFGSQLIKDIGIAMIGFLGFIVTGLAILTGTISSKVVKFFKSRGVYKEMEDILSSFYFIGLITALEIFIIFITYTAANIPIESLYIINIVLSCIISYLFIFTIFYAVGLVGNCLSIFSIIADIEDEIEINNKSIKAEYDAYRIMALEYIILMSSDSQRYEMYDRKIGELIKKDTNTTKEQKEKMLKIWNKHFGNRK